MKSRDFKRFHEIQQELLKATEFYRISLNSLQISLQILLQISLWMLFVDFTTYFIRFHCSFHYGFHCKFHYWFHDKFHYIYQDFTEINKILWNPQHFTGFHWNQQDFIMDFTVDSIPVKSVMKLIMKSENVIHSEIYNEILMISVKSVEFNEVLWNAVDFMKSCDILWISWNPVAFS